MERGYGKEGRGESEGDLGICVTREHAIQVACTLVTEADAATCSEDF